MEEAYEAIVVGGGIVGASTAYHLAREGCETLLVDRRDEGRATDAGAGILSAATSSRGSDSTWFDFATTAVDYYDELVAALEDEQDGPHGYAKRGLLNVAFGDDEVEQYDEVLERIRERQAAGGPPAEGTVHELSGEEAREHFPPLGETKRAFYYDDAARVDGQTFEGALRRAGEAHGLDTLEASVDSLVLDGDEVVGVVVEGDEADEEDELAADAVVVAGGAWSNDFGEQLGVEIPVEPQRGQIVHLDLDADTEGWPIVSPYRHKYMVSWDDGRVAVGATRETGSGFEPRTTVDGLHDVFGEILRVAPGLGDASLREVRVGLRPLAEDGLPVLGGVPGVDGAFLATGHGPSGLQLGPYSGKLVADAVRGEDVSEVLKPFGVERF
ncbi:FAD-dependent oxidoreductase [Haloprofundus marisrubri]|uniref:FAD-dependent oxidoreductase n=1 Tax=Haloprofundus marisrubri TaxID=1514971 RepID=A0A0W1REI3_9EURY|nr:FAD-dependent oxidoreductase [Haloprofundus marisrubri]